MCEAILDASTGIQEAGKLVEEVVAVTVCHINLILRGRAFYQKKKEVLMAKRMDIEFIKDGGPLPPGPLRHKHKAGYMRRYGRNPSPDVEPGLDETAELVMNHQAGQPIEQDLNLSSSDHIHPFTTESFLSSSPEIIAITTRDYSPVRIPFS
ncbi:hypothetical protein QAD02_022707 [Eretmocerus hayati]|uniref:Uncharacterized protein n=1 Tax=Eretmocerus hayati TaxID=131215 RepID=A0ACC2PUW5_9HYME|nr:hypothetical protein QAD02_022707 [Eretmocerus hayati]